MKWALVGVIVAMTAISDLLQSFEMKRQGELRSFGPSQLVGLAARLLGRPLLLVAVLCMAVSFFAFLELLRVADLSFAVPATAATYVLETLLARAVLQEKVAWQRWAGVVLVASGILLLAM